MGKLIAVWGVPASGKTVFSMKLAETLYHRDRGKNAVIVVFADDVTPTIPVVFPNFKSDDTFSVGTVLSKPDFFADDVVSNIVMLRDRMNLGFMGYKDGENVYSYPAYPERKAKHFYEVLCGNCDYVIVDCMTMPDANDLTKIALEEADEIIYLLTPDLKSISFQMSHRMMLQNRGYLGEKTISVMNIPRQELFLSASDAKAHLGKILFSLPYSQALAEQYMEGCLYEPLKDKKYMKIMQGIAERVV